MRSRINLPFLARIRSLRRGSGSSRISCTHGRSRSGAAASSPTIETSSTDDSSDRLFPNVPYTVSGETAARSAIAWIVVATNPRSTNSSRAAPSTAPRVALACSLRRGES